jgi:taurine dioxygenase
MGSPIGSTAIGVDLEQGEVLWSAVGGAPGPPQAGEIDMRGKPLSDALGVELLDFDITRPCDPGEQAELRRLFQEHHLLLVRGQKPSAEDHNRFVEVFGPLSAMLSNGDTGYVSNKIAAGTAKQGGGPIAVTGVEPLLWHADGTYGPHPGIGTSLLALDVAPGATPTLFANAVRALEKLPAGLRARIEPLRAVHMLDTVHRYSGQPWRERTLPSDAKPGRIRSHEHPVIFQPPHLDKQTIIANHMMTSHISNLDRDEGDALLDDIYARIYADENVYAHHWQTGDVLIWDNIALHHCRPSGMGETTRHLRRLSLDGWNGDEGVILWFATSTGRDLASYERQQEAARHG